MNIQIGEKLSELRKSNNYTQKDLAELLGVKPATIGHWEQNRNEPSYEMLKKITSLYKISLSELFDEPTDSDDNVNTDTKNFLLCKIIDMLIDEGLIQSDSQPTYEELDPISQNMIKAALDKILVDTYNKYTNK
ncbi:helix-turn-helix domain-containing protein [Oceanirhabdus sp. W0125-5]|uniref:helix-turn-helix domain-containing protein n=1 Tax=Oceanirhabdus sp. W0125-5 TaxID=2999116 RepID=UPI0022F2BCA2|nr:helix-turn-helix transcriptional regulator [Oceanirhabdus sp. W0125-5]WBW96056.1 helix-turn-helix transcriptional regulator [Oceanirhabdus sp. W0125-5]